MLVLSLLLKATVWIPCIEREAYDVGEVLVLTLRHVESISVPGVLAWLVAQA